MLVLSRKPGEQIIIGDNIRITVVSMGPGRVKVGIEAPGTVKVDRAEIHDRKLAEVAAPTAVVETATLHNRITGQLPEESADDLRFRPRKPR
jgi:carbon storage regulator CsrA